MYTVAALTGADYSGYGFDRKFPAQSSFPSR